MSWRERIFYFINYNEGVKYVNPCSVHLPLSVLSRNRINLHTLTALIHQVHQVLGHSAGWTQLVPDKISEQNVLCDTQTFPSVTSFANITSSSYVFTLQLNWSGCKTLQTPSLFAWFLRYKYQQWLGRARPLGSAVLFGGRDPAGATRPRGSEKWNYVTTFSRLRRTYKGDRRELLSLWTFTVFLTLIGVDVMSSLSTVLVT